MHTPVNLSLLVRNDLISNDAVFGDAVAAFPECALVFAIVIIVSDGDWFFIMEQDGASVTIGNR